MDVSSLASLPTDSLYKFMSIVGLITLAASIALPFYIRKNFAFQFFELEKQRKLTELKFKESERKFEDLKRSLGDRFTDLLSKVKAVPTEQRTKCVYEWYKENASLISEEQVDELVDKVTTFIDDFGIAAEVERENIELECEVKKIEFLSHGMVTLRRYQRVGLLLGFALSSTGFFLWYCKIQVFLDASIVNY